MKTKHIFFIIALAAVFTSCLPENNPPEPTYPTSLGTVDNPLESNLFTLIGDDGITYLVRETQFPDFKPKTETRLALVYNLLSKNDTTKRYEIRLVNGVVFMTNNVLPLTKAVADTIGNDPVSNVDMYIASHFLNVNFTFYASGTKAHYFNLVRPDTLIADNSLDTIKLEFRHNAKSDNSMYNFSNTVCFNISELKRFSINPDSIRLEISVMETQDYGLPVVKKYNKTYKF